MEENTIPEETLPSADCIDCDVCTCGKSSKLQEEIKTTEECFCGKVNCDCE